MRKHVLIITISLFCILPVSLFAFGGSSSSSNKAKTKYPIVLVHGIAMKSANLIGVDYWYGVADELENNGATVYSTQQHAFQSHSYRGQEVFEYLLYLRATEGHKKFNLIAHSQGALDARYLISNCTSGSVKGSDIVASLTSISGVHRGTKMADVALGIAPSSLEHMIAGAVDAFSQFFYDYEDNPDSLLAVKQLTTDFMRNSFNPNTPNVPDVYYQSWAGKIKWAAADFLFTEPLWLIMLVLEGANDAFVSVDSAKWGNYRGTITGAWWCGGVSHWGEIGHILGFTPGFDAPEFYVDVVKELKNLGY